MSLRKKKYKKKKEVIEAVATCVTAKEKEKKTDLQT